MTITATARVTTSNTRIYLDSVEGINLEDIVISSGIRRAENVRVIDIHSSTILNGPWVVLNTPASIDTDTSINFQPLLAGDGLFASAARSAFFMRVAPSYDPDIDPNLPTHTSSAADFSATATTLQLNSLLHIANVTFKHTTSGAALSNEVVLNSVANVQVLDYVLGNIQSSNYVLNSDITRTSNVRVMAVYSSNSTVKLNTIMKVANGVDLYFQRPDRPLLRVGTETIYYANVNASSHSVTDCVRNIANTRPSANWTWLSGNVVSILGSARL